METSAFIYINAKKVINAYSIYQVSESELHLQGICSRSNSLRTFRKDRVLKECSSLNEAISLLSDYPVSEHEFLVSKPKKANLFEVCFTGFKKDDKERLTAIATENKMSVRSSVTQNLQVLCCGYNAGPTKVSAARMKGVIILDEKQFHSLIETGEFPDF